MAHPLSASGDAERWRIEAGSAVHLSRIDAASTEGAPGAKAETIANLRATEARLSELQDRLWAEHRRSVLIVLQAMDTGGKDGTIKHVLRGVNPQGVKVTSFKEPSVEELAHDFLWRVHARTPAKGEIAVFNRSHYEDVLVVRVHGVVSKATWRARYDQIKRFEALLHANGTQIVKVFLRISKEEQGRRLQARIDDPAKRWKFRRGDITERSFWDDYMAAYQEAIRRTSTADAPWYVVPADRKWYRNWAVGRILVETLEAMEPKYPIPSEDVSAITIA